MRQRRRAERSHLGTRFEETRNRRVNEQRQQRLLIWGAAVVGVLLVVLLAAGWTLSTFLPSRQVVAVVDGESIRAQDLVPFTQLEGLISGFLQPQVALNNYMRGMVLRKRISTLGVSVTPEDVTGRIAQTFDPDYDEENPPTTLSQEGRRRLERSLGILKVSEQDYRTWVENQLLDEAAFRHFVTRTPNEAPQVFVHWIVTQTPEAATQALDRIQAGEEFAAVSRELNRETTLADENGEVGWVPEGAFSDLDPYLYGEDAVYGQAVKILDTIVLFVREGPSTQPVSEEMKERLAEPLLVEWYGVQEDELVDQLLLNNAHAQWIIEQLT